MPGPVPFHTGVLAFPGQFVGSNELAGPGFPVLGKA